MRVFATETLHTSNDPPIQERQGCFAKLKRFLGRAVHGRPIREILPKLLFPVVIVVGTYLTIIMCLDLFQQYNNQLTSTSVYLQKNKSNILPHPPTLCISVDQLYGAQLWYMQLYDTAIDYAHFDQYLNEINFKNKSFFSPDSNNVGHRRPRWPSFLIKAVDTYVNYNAQAPNLFYSDLVLPELQKLIDKIYSLGVTPEQLQKRLADELSNFASLSGSVYEGKTPYQDAVNTFFDQSTNLNNIVWKPSWYYLSLSCLNMATRVEHGIRGLADLIIRKTTMDGYTADVCDNSDRTYACIALENNLRTIFNISFDEYRQIFGLKMMSFQGVKFSHKDTNSVEYERIVERTTYVSSLEVCYQLRVEPFMDVSSIWAYDQYGYMGFPAPQNPPYFPNVTLALEFAGRERNLLQQAADTSLKPDESALLEVERVTGALQSKGSPIYKETIGMNKNVEISISALYHHVPAVRNENRCSPDKTMFNCFRDCRVAAIKTSLNCTPTSLIPLNGNAKEKECSIETLSNWKNDDAAALLDCAGNCLFPCEDWRVDIEQIEEEPSPPEIPLQYNFACFNLIYSISDYNVYEESFVWTTSSFAAAIGGVLGLWLGIDLFVATDTIFSLLAFLHTFCSCWLRWQTNVEEEVMDDDSVNEAVKRAEKKNQIMSEEIQNIKRLMNKMADDIQNLQEKRSNSNSHVDGNAASSNALKRSPSKNKENATSSNALKRSPSKSKGSKYVLEEFDQV